MKQWCRVKLKENDLFMGNALTQEVERKLAPIENYDAAVHRAERRFGRHWPKHAEIIEIDDYSEVQSWRGRRGGKTITARKRTAWLERFNYKWYIGRLGGGFLHCVGARSYHHVRKLLEKTGKKRCSQTIWNNFKPIKRCPWSLNRHPEEGVWYRDCAMEWHRIL